MEIKPAWLLEGMSRSQGQKPIVVDDYSAVVAPHYFKAADLEQLATGDKKMPNSKAIGASSSNGAQV